MQRQIQRYEVSLKAFIVDGDRALFLRESDTGFWELPGGRIEVGEEWLPHKDVLERELREELGKRCRAIFRGAAVTWTRQRPVDGVFQLVVGRVATLVAGQPVLSPEHDEFAWLTREASLALSFPTPSGYPAAIAELWDVAMR
jgi:8-oxo-dGTP pyrophosphatase MutT (NUDIX family)